ncbi:Carotenoid oxygenase [Gracilaria domingensis]|nr:Carotenoid oxygenase [Gracilaria domingensis]
MNSATNPTFDIGLRTVPEHPQFISLTVTGTLPTYLSNSSLFRIGPGRYEATHKDGLEYKPRHWFDGLSVLHHFDINAPLNQVSYRSRSLADPMVGRIESTKASSYAGFTFGRSDPCRSLLGKFFQLWTPVTIDPETRINTANVGVTVQYIPGKGTCARTDSTSSIKIDEETLEIDHFFRVSDFAGPKSAQMSAAHGHYDTQTGDFINFTFKFGPPKVEYTVFRTDRTGASHVLATFRDTPRYIHSFATTEKYVILILWPLELNSLAVAFNKSIMDGMTFHKEQETRFVVISRAHNRIQAIYTYDSFFCLHNINAYDAGDSVVIDLSLYEDASILFDFELDKFRTSTEVSQSSFVRFTLDSVTDGTALASPRQARMKVISAEPFELMRVRPDKQRCEYQYAYGVTRMGYMFDAVAKVSVSTGNRQIWKPKNGIVGEPIFVPNPDGDDEDEGCLLIVVLNSEQEHSTMFVVDAKCMKTIAQADVPFIVPLGFHGLFKHT